MQIPFVVQVGAIGGAVLLFMLVGFAILVKNFYRKVLPGQALINNKTGGKTEVSFQVAQRLLAQGDGSLVLARASR